MDKLKIDLANIYKKVVAREKKNYNIFKKHLSKKNFDNIIYETNRKYSINISKKYIKFFCLDDIYVLVKKEFLKNQLHLALSKQYIPKIKDKAHYKLSHIQRRLWTLYKMKPHSPFYNVRKKWRIEGIIDIDIFKKSINFLINRHKILRTNFHEINGHPVQVVNRSKEIDISIFNFSKDKLSVRKKKEDKIVKKIAEKSFKLESDLLFRIGIVKISKKECNLFIIFHHIIIDNVSLKIFHREFLHAYRAFKRNKRPSLPELLIHYKDYSEYEQSKKNKKRIKNQKKYWLNKLKGDLPVLNLPEDKSRPLSQTYNGAYENILLDREVIVNLKKIARENNTTLFVIMFAIFNIFINKITEQDDIIIGIISNNRDKPELESSIGSYNSNLAIRYSSRDNKTIPDCFCDIKSEIILAMENSGVSFDYLVEKLSLERDASRSPIFNILFRNVIVEKQDIEGLSDFKMKLLPFDHDYTHFDLMPTLVESPQGFLNISFLYNTDLFYSQTIKQFLNIYKTLIEQIIKNPNQKISELSIIAPKEDKLLQNKFNDTKTKYPKNKTIHQLFEEQVKKTPSKVAIEYNKEKLTYKELNEKANKLAHYLKEEYKIKIGGIISLLLERTPESIISILAILKNGCSYLPIDPGYPSKRIEYMLKQSKTKVVLTDNTNKTKLSKTQISKKNIINIDEKEQYSHYNKTNIESKTKETDLAYIIYTSGSTGDPKGVQIQHKAILNTLYWLQDEFKLKKKDIIAQKTALSFTDSVWEIFWPLINGSKLSIIPDMIVKEPKAFIRELKNRKITYTQFVPALMTLFLEYGGTKETSSINTKRILPDLKYIFNGGEALPPSLANRWYRTFPNVKIANIYGMTESAIYATNYIVPKISDENQISVPLGKPIANEKVYILNNDNQINPRGISGEIAIAGKSLASGYLRKLALTRESFIKYGETGEILYKTGDMGKIDYNFNLHYLGRVDHQVQIRGYRVEIGEVESNMRKYNKISQCAVITRESKQKIIELVAFYASKEKIETDEVREYLKQNLPDYMVPGYIMEIEEFPLNVHGKIDRKALLKFKSIKKQKTIKQAPKTKTEKKLAKIWKEVLGIKKISEKDNFFSLGGHSLSAIDVLHRVNQEMGVEIFLEDIFNNMELFKLSAVIEEKILKSSN